MESVVLRQLSSDERCKAHTFPTLRKRAERLAVERNITKKRMNEVMEEKTLDAEPQDQMWRSRDLREIRAGRVGFMLCLHTGVCEDEKMP